ncbi:MAG TPA: SRPBCC family protein [Candidatus Acidoferrum sp.]|nr:SRPBCC family protein [Candidatus Acidoferrum sp.]
MEEIVRSAIKSIDIQATVDKTFAFLADPLNWPRYAVVNLRSVTPGQNGWFKAVTKFGEGEIKVDGVEEFGILDHVWKDPQASWKVYCRVVPNGDGSTVMMTLFQPPVMNDQMFDHAMKEMDIEMAKLKEVLESQRPRVNIRR